MSLYCAVCLILGAKMPRPMKDDFGDAFATRASAVIDGQSMCRDHARKAVLAARRKKVRK